MVNQRGMAEKLYKDDPDLAMRIALGEEKAPNGILSAAVYAKVCDEAEKSEDLDICRQLANSLHNSKISAEAQNLKFRNADSPIETMKDIVNARRETLNKTLPKGKTGDEMDGGENVDLVLRVATVVVVLAAAGVLIGALGRHPYSYYTVLRWLACSAAVLLVWRGAVQGIKWAWALVPLAILFNPIAPMHFSVNTWRNLDIAAAVVMVLAVILMEIEALLRERRSGHLRGHNRTKEAQEAEKEMKEKLKSVKERLRFVEKHEKMVDEAIRQYSENNPSKELTDEVVDEIVGRFHCERLKIEVNVLENNKPMVDEEIRQYRAKNPGKEMTDEVFDGIIDSIADKLFPNRRIESMKAVMEHLEDPATIFSFGQMSFDGDGVPQDYVAAANWFRIAAEQGHAKAQHNLALMYENVQGVSQDSVEAAKWYHMAAEQGLASSQNNLGRMYENGDGVTQDHSEAIKWYRRAAENGDENAPSNLNRLEERTDRDKYQDIWFAFIELMVAENIPLIGDCSMLPHPKKTILYAIRWLMDYYENEQETTSDHTIRAFCDKMLPKLSDMFSRLARDWQEIDPEDKDAIAKLGGCESFPDWALPLKLKYIDEEKASNEAFDVSFEVLKDRVATKRINSSDPEYGSNNTIVTREEYEAAKKRLREQNFFGDHVSKK